MKPAYIGTYESGELDEKIEILDSMLEECELCARRCGVNRKKGEKGYCRSGHELIVSSAHPHFGEEDVLVGIYGSGTIFLTNCNLRCCFCQNYDISHLGYGRKISEEELANMMLSLQSRGCHNINFVTPTHFTPQIVKGIKIAIERGLDVPIVYNCGGYESVDTLRVLEGIIDIYMPDMKYGDEEHAKKYSDAENYFEVCKKAVKEMHRQVGVLKTDERGIARRGLLIRHLVMPNGVAGSEHVLRFIAEEISKDSYVNIMAQYRPMLSAYMYEGINRPIRMG